MVPSCAREADWPFDLKPLLLWPVQANTARRARKEGQETSGSYLPDTTEQPVTASSAHREAETSRERGKAQRRQGAAVAIGAEAWAGPGQKARGSAGGCCPPVLPPLIPPAPSLRARRAPTCGMVFLGLQRRQEKYTEASSGAQKGRMDQAGVCF